VSYGVGVIGSMVARTIIEKKKDWLNIVGALDIDPAKLGKDLGQVVGLNADFGIPVQNDPERTIKESDADIVIHTTSSQLEKVVPELKRLAECGVDIISSCEELSYPYATNGKTAEEINRIAKENGVTILGTGINPGFLMDVLPIVLTTPCIDITRIRVERQMNAANRRIPFQKKIGAGMALDEYRAAIRNKSISGHVGLFQSMSMLADSLGWKLDKIEIQEPEPVVLENDVSSNWITVERGMAAGSKQSAKGIMNGRSIIDYEFRAYIGAKEEFDLVDIEGTPKVHFKSTPCVNGDSGTIAMLINNIPKVIEARPGLLTMKDLTLPSAAHVTIS
jgi:hypothetical protein